MEASTRHSTDRLRNSMVGEQLSKTDRAMYVDVSSEYGLWVLRSLDMLFQLEATRTPFPTRYLRKLALRPEHLPPDAYLNHCPTAIIASTRTSFILGLMNDCTSPNPPEI